MKDQADLEREERQPYSPPSMVEYGDIVLLTRGDY